MIAVATSTEHFVALIALLGLILSALAMLGRIAFAAMRTAQQQIDATQANTKAIESLTHRVNQIERDHGRGI